MADNYLENKYAEYQARKTSGTRTGHTTKTLHKTRRVFITGGAEGIGKAIVRAFRGAGHRVAFCNKILSINLRPAFITSRRLALHRQSLDTPNPYGRIINICSTRYLMSEPGSEGYAASKGGIYSLTHALALSLSEWHITVNSIAPGWIQNNNYDQLRPEDHAQHPSGRVGKPEDIARMCLFLCQEENDFINGENITIDGGMSKKMIYLD
jgi:NAD(P)-dependent dehydrogenase (short-subunit alcohol dehydrogenase family)